MVMALIVLLGFGLLFMYASDETERVGQSIESVVAQQKREIDGHEANIAYDLLKLEQAPARIANAKEFARFQRENQARQENLTTLASEIEAGKADLVLKKQNFANYKDQYRTHVRSKAKGEAMESLKTLSGAVYTNVNIREVTAIGIQIRHADGQKRIPFEDLPEAMKDHFQFDPQQKDTALAEESKTREAHEAAVEVANVQVDEKMDRQREKDAELAKQKLRQAITVKEGMIGSAKEELSDLEGDLNRAASDAAAARSSGRMFTNNSGSISASIRQKRSRLSALQAELAQMKARL